MDFDGDGRTDILSGSWPGALYWFRRGPDGEFGTPETIKGLDGKELNVGYASTVFAGDWDADGDLDLLLGNISGEIYLIPNTGSPQDPKFGEPARIIADGEAITAPGGDAHLIAADWDGDSKLDLLLGTGEGSVLWFRNIGTEKAPALARCLALVEVEPMAGKADSGEARLTGRRSKICVTDWNGDGRLDLLVGDFWRGGRLPEPDTKPVEEVSEDEKALNELLGQWAKVYADYRNRRDTPDDESKTSVEVRKNELHVLRSQLRRLKDAIAAIKLRKNVSEDFAPRYDYHGYAWLFLRKGLDSGSEKKR